MPLKSLRTNIALNLVVLLLVSMLLIDLVMLIVTQRMLIGERIEKGRVLIVTLSNGLIQVNSDGEQVDWRINNPNRISRLIESAGGVCSLAVTVNGEKIYRGGLGCLQQDSMAAMAYQAAVEGKEITSAEDIFQGIFLQQPGQLLLAAPLFVDDKIVAGGSVLVSLDDIHNLLRRFQHILLIYTLINTAILTLFGVYRLNKIAVKPIQRLVKRAEAYRDYDDDVFILDREDNEFSQLSKSLNRMLMHLAQDKEKLQESVHSLEMANAELEKAQRDLIRAEKLASVGRLSAGIAHEIGNPIGIIKGYLALINDPSTSDEEKADFIQRTEKEVERINSIIQQLLDFSRPSGEEQDVISVHELIEDLEEVCRFQPALSCIQIQLKLEAKEDHVAANARQLRQVFLNLVLNASDAVRDSDDDGKLIIHSENRLTSPGNYRNQGLLVIQFEDSGNGIPDETLSNIFDPFFTTKPPGKGTGLGLSVSFTIIEGLGGTIKAERNENGGTCMTIELPLAPRPID